MTWLDAATRRLILGPSVVIRPLLHRFAEIITEDRRNEATRLRIERHLRRAAARTERANP